MEAARGQAPSSQVSMEHPGRWGRRGGEQEPINTWLSHGKRWEEQAGKASEGGRCRLGTAGAGSHRTSGKSSAVWQGSEDPEFIPQQEPPGASAESWDPRDTAGGPGPPDSRNLLFRVSRQSVSPTAARAQWCQCPPLLPGRGSSLGAPPRSRETLMDLMQAGRGVCVCLVARPVSQLYPTLAAPWTSACAASLCRGFGPQALL